MSQGKQKGVRVVSSRDQKKDPSGKKVRILKADSGQKTKGPPRGDKEISKRPVVRRKQKLPPATAKARQTGRSEPGRGSGKKPDQPKRTRPGRSQDVPGGKKPPKPPIEFNPAELKVPVGLLMLNLTGWVAEKRNDARCIATKQEVQVWEDYFNWWLDYRLPILAKFSPEIAMLTPWIAWFQRISTLPPKRSKIHATEND